MDALNRLLTNDEIDEETATVSGHGPRSPARDRTITLVKTLGRRQWQKASG